MLLPALLLAAVVQIVQPAPREAAATGVPCRAAVDQAVTRPVGRSLAVTKLGDLPPANHTLTVLRSVDGCPVSSTVRYRVDLPARR